MKIIKWSKLIMLIFICFSFASEAFGVVIPLCSSSGVDFNNSGDKRYYEIYIEAGKNLLVVLDGPASSRTNLYIKYNQIPTSGDYDDSDVLEEDPAVGIYGTQKGYYYIMLESSSFSADDNYILTPCTNFTSIVNDIKYKFNNSGDKRYYEVYAEDDKNLSIILDGPASSRTNLHIKYNQIPTSGDYDDSDVLEEDPAVGIYGTQKGYYYIMLESSRLPSEGEDEYILRAYSASTPPDIPVIPGDANFNGKLDLQDVLYILQIMTDIRP